MPRYSVTRPLGPEAIDYEMVPGADPLETLRTLHRDGLGKNAVRLVEGRLVVADPADRELCAGAWKIVRAEMGIDSPEGSQVCQRAGRPWRAGTMPDRRGKIGASDRASRPRRVLAAPPPVGMWSQSGELANQQNAGDDRENNDRGGQHQQHRGRAQVLGRLIGHAALPSAEQRRGARTFYAALGLNNC